MLGVRPGERVACLLSNTPASCAALIGSWMAGGCVVSLPGMARGMAWEAYLAQLDKIIVQADPALLFVSREYLPFLGERWPSVRVVALQEVDGPAVSESTLPGPEEQVFVQYSSGTTSEPRGSTLSAGAIANQLSMLEVALRTDPEADVCVGWVPVSHDMGLFGCVLLMGYWVGARLVLSPPERFVSAPQSWFADCARFGATITCAPNFGLHMAARLASQLPDAAVPIRRLVLGGERVDPLTMERACAALGPSRLPKKALMPAYGLAEVVLAATIAPFEAEPAVLSLDRRELARGTVRPFESHAASDTPSLVTSVGVPLQGVEVDILGREDVGEVRVRSPSLSDGYLNAPKATAERFTPQGLLTGDLGFLYDGSLYITGRKSDLLVVGGRNVYARDLEVAILSLGGIRWGSCALVVVDEGVEPRLVAVVEPVEDHPEFSLLAERMATAVRSAAGVRLSECVFLGEGCFPRTPSGKPQRFRCQEIASDRAFSAAERCVPGKAMT
jgi:fatty-acyl-CoA synthase